MHFSSNIKFLRVRNEWTQDVMAGKLGLSRSTMASYENGSIVNPTVEALLMFSDFFKISIDTLIRIDLEKLSEHQVSELERGFDSFIRGSKLRVLATTVNNDNKENIELVPLKAKAGYMNGYSDLDFIKKLPTFQLPILFNDRKYRMFQVSGDSMRPVPDKSWVIGEFVENFYDIKDGQPYIFLTLNEGIVFKTAFNQLRKKKNLLLKSLNPAYAPYEIDITDVKEAWRFCNYISSEIPDQGLRKDELKSAIESIEKQIGSLKKTVEQSS